MVSLKNPRQERFCLEYLATGNATQSAIKAGYSRKTAAVIASRMLKFVNISQRLRELQAETTNSRVMDITERLERLSEIAREGNIKQTNPVEAIRELNRMGGDYPQQQVKHEVVFQIEYFNRPAFGQVIEGESRELPEGR